jgi:hypothetical protein
MVNIGVGPSNAKTITDHLAALRPDLVLMIGHCAGLRNHQDIGDLVLATSYLRDDRVLDGILPLSVPVVPNHTLNTLLLSELTARGLRSRMGIVFTTADRNWELNLATVADRLRVSRAVAVDMESATVAANGFRYRIPACRQPGQRPVGDIDRARRARPRSALRGAQRRGTTARQIRRGDDPRRGLAGNRQRRFSRHSDQTSLAQARPAAPVANRPRGDSSNSVRTPDRAAVALPIAHDASALVIGTDRVRNVSASPRRRYPSCYPPIVDDSVSRKAGQAGRAPQRAMRPRRSVTRTAPAPPGAGGGRRGDCLAPFRRTGARRRPQVRPASPARPEASSSTGAACWRWAGARIR